ncbi:ChaN family lipoprotein [Nitrosophilus kaiyonis]|uniref:ChaN family lipoprotein n=1 Tax=Nitrosophilus kaiyonis TaxID=2930200 RepID=UPI002492638F|nr:ChaN family lipoprotein [Nitrosophilus kaiyonis]
MYKIKFLLLLIPIFLFANICSYDIDIKLQDKKVSGKALLDFNSSIVLDPTKAEIFYIKNGTLELSDYPKYKKITKKPIEIGFFYKFKPFKNRITLFEPWYPRVEKRCTYKIKIDSKYYIAILQYTKKEKNIFYFDKPLKNLYLIASKDFIVKSKKEKNLEISTFFYKKDSNLSKSYFDKSFEYFNLYKNIFGFLPYKIFNIVEIPYPVAYSMATMSVIGEQIIDKDYILNESLAHEIVHQWFGNYVFSPNFGNWCEGLTTFYSDHFLAKDKKEFRKEQLLKYISYVNEDNEIPLIEFGFKEYEDKNAIGYGKGFFFFYMLKNLIGNENFQKGIKELLKNYKFKEANFSDLQKLFEKVSKKDLKDFFLEWVYRKGAFDFDIKNIDVIYDKDRYIVDFDFISNEYDIKVPVKICSDKKCKKFYIDSNKTKQSLKVNFEPRKIVVDDEYEIFRKLKPSETPPIISKVLGSQKLLVICDEQNRYKNILKNFKNVKKSDDIKFKDIKNFDILILGKTKFLKRFSIPFKMEGNLKIEAFKNPLNDSKTLLVIENNSEDLKKSFRLLRHLGKYSIAIFDKKGIKKYKKIADDGAVYNLDIKTDIVKVKSDDFEKMVDEIKNAKVVFVGENHPIYSNHLNQLKIIKALYKKDKNLAIGLEMFQKPYQKYLDMFIEGKIGEKEMLKRSEYSKRWGYDYNLYRPIILYAKKHKIRLIALNIPKEISQKVARKGIDSLSKKEKKFLPKSLDFKNLKYKKYIKEIFEGHMKKKFKDFENFYYAQILWDESMAEGIYQFLKKNRNYKMVVLAGNGHLRYGYGIPDRLKRRGIKDYKIILQDDKTKPDIADFVLYPTHIDLPSKKLGVYLKDSKNLIVEKVIKDSAAFRAGLKKGDKIIKIDNENVKNLKELKLELVFVKDCANLEIIRDKKIIKKRVCFKKY